MAAPENTDALKLRWSGVALHGPTPFDTTLISKIQPGLYLGGVKPRVPLPAEIEYVVSLYGGAAYGWHPNVRGAFIITDLADDALSPQGLRQIDLAADVALTFRDLGPTLIHCQAGLNRSSLVMARMFTKAGMPAQEALDLIREKRSPACLCNPYFEDWLLAQE